MISLMYVPLQSLLHSAEGAVQPREQRVHYLCYYRRAKSHSIECMLQRCSSRVCWYGCTEVYDDCIL